MATQLKSTHREAPVSAHNVEEQRTAPRFTLMLRPARLHCRAGQFLCVVRDVSDTGVRVKVFHDLPDEAMMAIEVSEGRRAAIERVWAKDGEVGFRFCDALDLPEFLAECERFPRRQFRMEIDRPVQVTGGGFATRSQVINISQQGACIDCPERLVRHQLVRLDMEGLPAIHAKVMWRQGTVHGLVFENTFALRDFAFSLGRLQGLA